MTKPVVTRLLNHLSLILTWDKVLVLLEPETFQMHTIQALGVISWEMDSNVGSAMPEQSMIASTVPK
jgi:hypothetical protein